MNNKTIGSLIESLLRIKKYNSELDNYDTEVINKVCNILDKNFDRNLLVEDVDGTNYNFDLMSELIGGNKMMKVSAFYNQYITDGVFIVFEIPHDKINHYSIYRDNVCIASSDNTEFTNPTLFDRDHGTNLFKTDMFKKLMFLDKTVSKFTNYSYHVVCKYIDENGTVLDNIRSNDVLIKTV